MAHASWTSRLLSHTLVAAIAAAVGWISCEIAAPSGDDSAAAIARGENTAGTPQSTQAGQDMAAQPGASRRSSPHDRPAVPGRLGVWSDGSVVLPPDLIGRFEINLHSLDDDDDREELAMLGFSKEETDALFALAEQAKLETRAGELARAEPIAKTETHTILKLPALSPSQQEAQDKIRAKYEAIVGSRSALVGSEMVNIFGRLFGEHRHSSVIACRWKGEGDRIDYGYYRLKPGMENEISPDITREELERRADSRSTFGSFGPDDDYEYLFQK